ncbi:hypothetical protein [Oenococcus sp.]|uniref:hypothetical protein n=1 Tax=Oenococcus sp. TaxID=1979414 RepID=UPI0039ED0244
MRNLIAFEYLKTRKSLSRLIPLGFFLLLPIAIFFYQTQQVTLYHRSMSGQIQTTHAAISNSYLAASAQLKKTSKGSPTYITLSRQMTQLSYLGRLATKVSNDFDSQQGQPFLRDTLTLHRQMTQYTTQHPEADLGFFISDQELARYAYLSRHHLALEQPTVSAVFPNFLIILASYLFSPLGIFATVLVIAIGFLIDAKSPTYRLFYTNSPDSGRWVRAFQGYFVGQYLIGLVVSLVIAISLSLFSSTPYLRSGHYSWTRPVFLGMQLPRISSRFFLQLLNGSLAIFFVLALFQIVVLVNKKELTALISFIALLVAGELTAFFGHSSFNPLNALAWPVQIVQGSPVTEHPLSLLFLVLFTVCLLWLAGRLRNRA